MSLAKALLISASLLLLSGTAFSAGRLAAQPQNDVCAAVMEGVDATVVWRNAPVSVSEASSTPRLIGSPDVAYPLVARQSRVSGNVCLQVKLDEQGRVRKAQAMCGPSMLRVFAEHAVRQWRYTPKISEGRAVEADGYVILVYKLD